MMRLPMMNQKRLTRDVRSPEQREADRLRKEVYAAWQGEEDEEDSESDTQDELTEEDLDDVIESEAELDEVRQVAPLRLHPCGEARRPCPRTECRMHVNHTEDKRRDGPHEGPESCALDMIQQAPKDEGLTLEDIGAVLGLTRERVRQIEAEAMRKLARKSDVRQLIGELVGRRKT